MNKFYLKKTKTLSMTYQTVTVSTMITPSFRPIDGISSGNENVACRTGPSYRRSVKLEDSSIGYKMASENVMEMNRPGLLVPEDEADEVRILFFPVSSHLKVCRLGVIVTEGVRDFEETASCTQKARVSE